jgi:FkbM family methyltransferase
VEVLPVESLAQAEGRFVLIYGRFLRNFAAECARFGVDKWIVAANLPGDMITQACMLEPYESIDADESYHDLYELLADEKSKRVLKDLLTFKATADMACFQSYAHEGEEQYFPPDLNTSIDHRHIIEAGAFTGDTLKRWAAHMLRADAKECSYRGFEPSRPTFELLRQTVDTLPEQLRSCVTIENAGVGKRADRLPLYGGDTAASFQSSARQATPQNFVDIVPLDRYIASKISCIVADIEGCESDLLCGADAIIHAAKPTLALCVYHKKKDIYNIPFQVADFSKRYRLYLRQHSDSYTETVCYAIWN